jgi:GT2 family glycosyltransferase
MEYHNIQKCLDIIIHNSYREKHWLFSSEVFPGFFSNTQIKSIDQFNPPNILENNSIIILQDKLNDFISNINKVDSIESFYIIIQTNELLEYQHELFYYFELFPKFILDLDFNYNCRNYYILRFNKNFLDPTQSIILFQKYFLIKAYEIVLLRKIIVDYKHKIAKSQERNQLYSHRLQELKEETKKWEIFYNDLLQGKLWKTLIFIRSLRNRLIPPGTLIEKLLKKVFKITIIIKESGFIVFLQKILIRIGLEINLFGKMEGESKNIEPILTSNIIKPYHLINVDIIICIHNNLKIIQKCIESVIKNTRQPYHLILIDNSSNHETSQYLLNKKEEIGATLFQFDKKTGIAHATNQGLQLSSADMVVLLDSTSIVTSDWLDRMIFCANTDEKIGVVGTLSNISYHQYLQIFESEDLHSELSIEKKAELIAKYSGNVYPDLPIIGGPCLLIKRQVFNETGFFNDIDFVDTFEFTEDYTIHAREANWKLVLADDVYVHQLMSKFLDKDNSQQIIQKHLERKDQKDINEEVSFFYNSRVIEGIKAAYSIILDREDKIIQGFEKYAGKKLLFILPIENAGGGGNIVISEANAMIKMGVEVFLFNTNSNKEGFTNAYPYIKIPVIFGEVSDLNELANRFDAIIATYNPTVSWMKNLSNMNSNLIRGYYIQGFEPLMYDEKSEEFEVAWNSYKEFPELLRFTKTDWTRETILKRIGVDSHNIGVSIEIDIFQPREGFEEWKSKKAVNITAMIRPESHYRAPYQTMLLLRKIKKHFGEKVNIMLYGTTLQNKNFQLMPLDFKWELYGILSPERVASLMSKSDIFIDCSTHQAMGLAALEAMACGNAVIVPQNGGSTSIVEDGIDGIIVDTLSFKAMFNALKLIIENNDLRRKLQINAIHKTRSFYPEKAALNILDYLFYS